MTSSKTVSERSSRVSPSQTMSISAISSKLQAEGIDIANLAVGQPDFPTPEFVKQAAITAIHQNKTGYTVVDGVAELKQAIINKSKRDNRLDYSEENIIVSCGAKHSLYVMCQALLSQGDEVIIPAPYWISYPDIVKLSDARPVIVETSSERKFKMSAEQLEQHISKQTRMLFLNSPNNPSGSVYSKSELLEIGEVVKKYPNLMVCSDDIYEHFVFDGKSFYNLLNAHPDLKERCVVINGVSKAYSMTGWRIGWAAGPKTLIAAMKKIQSQSTSNPCSISQYASQAALEGSLDYVYKMRDAFAERRDYLIDELNKINGIHALVPEGSFYVFANFTEAISQHPKVSNDLELAEFFLTQAHVSTVPGTAFGTKNYLRFSLAASFAQLKKAVKRIAQALDLSNS